MPEPDPGAQPTAAATVDARVVWVLGRAVAVDSGAWPSGQTPRAVLRLAGPVQPAWRQALLDAGLALRFWCPPFGACVDLPARFRRSPKALNKLGFVVGGVDLSEELCQRFADDQAVSESPLPAGLLDLVCFSREHLPTVEKALVKLGIPILDRSTTKLRVGWNGDPAVLRELPGVKLVDPARLPQLLFVQQLRECIGQGGGSSPPAGLDGEGEVIAVSDTGLDSGDPNRGMHPDFAGRIIALESLPMNPSWLPFATPAAPNPAPAAAAPDPDDAGDRGPKGHGTHVAGLAVGTGAASGGLHGGVAPAAKLVFLALEREVRTRPEVAAKLPSGFYLAGRPIDLRDLLQRGLDRGASIHNLSWGDPVTGAYTDDCHEVDLFLSRNPDTVVVCAAGNEGADRDGDRTLDRGSLCAPATAKNVIAVGATEGPLDSRLGFGSRAVWGDFDPLQIRWASTADRKDPVSGEPQRLAPISSVGPTRDGRIKPDLCAPGTNLASTRSQQSSGQGWGLASPLPLYAYNGGTSMSAPVVSGVLAVLRQAWRRHLKRAPSGPALKALLLIGALPVTGRSGRLAAAFEAGFGRVDVAGSLPPTAPQARLGWRIDLHDSAATRVDTGEQQDVAITTTEPTRLRAVLCWYDEPGERLINDLDLSLRDASDTVLAWGSAASDAATTPDRSNTVERIDLRLPAGRYRLRVAGYNVMQGPQRYALAWALQRPP